MSEFAYSSDEVLRPIPGERPCGEDLRYSAEFAAIVEARRSDADIGFGVWEPEGGRKSANWTRVAQLCLEALRDRTKDLRLACYLTEAALWLDGFAGLRDCFRLTTGLIRDFWDQGLFPVGEDGDAEYRAGPLSWLNDTLPGEVGQIPITAAIDHPNFGLNRYRQAQRVGTLAAIASVSGEKRAALDGYREQGWPTLDEFGASLAASKSPALEAIYQPFEEARLSLLALEKEVDGRFGAGNAPTFSDAKEAFQEIAQILTAERAKRRKLDEQHDRSGGVSQIANAGTHAVPAMEQAAATGEEWEEAEALMRAGEIDRGLARLASLAARETSGRGRFLRKLTLADVCVTNGRHRLARTVLEELNQQIDERKLAEWESSSVVGAVWSRLYGLCRKSDNSADVELANRLYSQLCRLDPWQAYVSCED